MDHSAVVQVELAEVERYDPVKLLALTKDIISQGQNFQRW